VLPCVPWFRTLPPSSGGLWCSRMFCGSGLRHSARTGSSAATCPVAPDPASLCGRFLMLSYVLRLSAGCGLCEQIIITLATLPGRALLRHVRVLPRQIVIMGLQDVW
jgi:hypothetical protein